MKTYNLGCSGCFLIGIVVLIIGFIVNNLWILALIFLVIAIAIYMFRSENNQNVEQNNQTISYDVKPDSYTNIKTSSYNSYRQTDRSDIKYLKVKATPNDYIVFDLETSGLDYKTDDILEIGAIKYSNGSEVDRFQTYVKTNKTIPARITEINGISNETVKNAPLIRTALKDFIDFIGDYTLIAFNSDFDMSFIQYN